MSMPTKDGEMNDRRVYMVGIGILPKLHISRQAIATIKKAGCVVYFSDPQLTEIFHELDVLHYEELDSLYEDGGIDEDNYGAILNRIVELLDEHGSVAFVSQGNPRLGVSLVDMLDEAQDSSDFTLDVLPGISSFETLIIDAKCDPLERGTVIMDANRWLLFKHKPSTELDYFIYHVCSVATRNTNYSDAAIGNRLDLLQHSLLGSYSSDHPCKLIQSSGAGADSAITYDITVGTLAESLDNINFATTLYIPSVGTPPVDEEVLAMMMAS